MSVMLDGIPRELTPRELESDAFVLSFTQSSFPAHLLSVPRQDWSTTPEFRRRLPNPQYPSLLVEIVQAARRASRAWSKGQWRDIDETGFALVIMDKVMQLNEYMREYTDETRPVGADPATKGCNGPGKVFWFSAVMFFESWLKRVNVLTEWMYSAAVKDVTPPASIPTLDFVKQFILYYAEVFNQAGDNWQRQGRSAMALVQALSVEPLGKWHQRYQAPKRRSSPTTLAWIKIMRDSAARERRKKRKSKTGGRMHRIDNAPSAPMAQLSLTDDQMADD